MSDRTAVADRHLQFDRVFDAPRDRVFAAWTDPDQIATWWGPDGFDTPRDKIDVELRVGGRFDVVMVVRSGEIAAGMGVEPGTEFPDRNEIVELAEGELLVLRSEPQPHIGLPEPVLTRVEFRDEREGRTRVSISSGPYSAEMAPNAETGWTQQLDNLERLAPALTG